MTERCRPCDGRMDRPGLFRCDNRAHPEPTLAQRVVGEVLDELGNRTGLGFGCLAADVRDQIRDQLAERVAAILPGERRQPA